MKKETVYEEEEKEFIREPYSQDSSLSGQVVHAGVFFSCDVAREECML